MAFNLVPVSDLLRLNWEYKGHKFWPIHAELNEAFTWDKMYGPIDWASQFYKPVWAGFTTSLNQMLYPEANFAANLTTHLILWKPSCIISHHFPGIPYHLDSSLQCVMQVVR